MTHVWFRKGKLYRTTADTFGAPDYPPRWVVKEGDEWSWGRVQRIAKGTLVRCLGIIPSDGEEPDPDPRIGRLEERTVFAFFEDCETGASIPTNCRCARSGRGKKLRRLERREPGGSRRALVGSTDRGREI